MPQMCESKFALGSCAWARLKKDPNYCAIAGNDPLSGIRSDVEKGIKSKDEALQMLNQKVEQFESDPDCVLSSVWKPQYQAFAAELSLRK